MKDAVEITDAREYINGQLKALGEGIDMPLELDEDGVCTFEFRENVIVVLEVPEDGGMAHLYSPLARVPESEDAAFAFFLSALELNQFTAETRGGTISFSRELGQLMLDYSLLVEECEATVLGNVVNSFYETVLDLRTQLEGIEEEEKQASGGGRHKDIRPDMMA